MDAHWQMVSDIAADGELAPSLDLLARMEAVEGWHGLRWAMRHEIARRLVSMLADGDDPEAIYATVMAEVLDLAALVTGAVERLQGRDISPARFATTAYQAVTGDELSDEIDQWIGNALKAAEVDAEKAAARKASRKKRGRKSIMQPTAVVTPLRTVGDGAETVYLYFQHAERQVAQHEGQDCWPCKIGFTTQILTNRILQQCTPQSSSVLPIVGLAIKTDDARALERITHLSLEAAGIKMTDRAGGEWFKTTPEQVADWYEAYTNTVAALRKEAA